MERCAHKSKNEKEEFEDDSRSGRPVTTFTPTKIDRVRQLIENDPRIIHNEIEAENFINKCAAFMRSFIAILN